MTANSVASNTFSFRANSKTRYGVIRPNMKRLNFNQTRFMLLAETANAITRTRREAEMNVRNIENERINPASKLHRIFPRGLRE